VRAIGDPPCGLLRADRLLPGREEEMLELRNRILAIAGALLIVGASAGGVLYAYWDRAVPLAGMAVNFVRTLTAPSGTTTTEEAAPSMNAEAQSATQAAVPASRASADDWAGCNRTLTSERYSPLGQINTTNISGLKVLCIYETRQYTAFEPGLIVVDGAMIGTTEHDIFSLDLSTCRENWRTHEDYLPASALAVNRGAAYMDGLLSRGTEDARVLAYDFKTGKRVWETTIANPELGESTPAAPIAWNGLVFIGNVGGNNKGVKRRMYALEAKTGRIVWEFYLVPKTEGDLTRGPQGATPLDLATWRNTSGTPITGGATWTSYTLDPATGELYVPGGNPAPDFAIGLREGGNLYSGSVVVFDAKTGAYKNHFKLVRKDWHDWDVSNAPALIRTRGGKKLLSVAPKDGHVHGFDLATNALRYRTPVTRVENVDGALAVGKRVHFCPGTVGGAEWNGPACDPQTNLILIGEVDWCATVTLQRDEEIQKVAPGQPWSAMATHNPYDTYGTPDSFGHWAGWVYAVDADSGVWIMAAEVQLSHPKWHDAYRRRARVLRRHGRELLRTECLSRPTAMGSQDRRRDRRGRHDLHRERRSEGGGRSRLYVHPLADRGRDRESGRPWFEVGALRNA
jgi:alcohol dehydrogenase (cytochrome c)